MKRVLFSQNESPLKDDYFVIDGILENNNLSDLSLEAFKLINSIENWKVVYGDSEIKIQKNGKFLSIKSHYKDLDDSDRFLFYIYFVELNDIGIMLDYLKQDSEKIDKNLAFEASELISKIKKKENFKKIMIGIFVSLIISAIVWEIVK